MRSGSSRSPSSSAIAVVPSSSGSADDRELEEPESGPADGPRRLGDDHVHRASGQRQQRAGAARERHRDQHLRRRGPQPAGDRHGHRQQCGGRAVRGDHRGQHAGQQHDRAEQPVAGAAGPTQLLPGPRGDAGRLQALADHEQRRDEDDHLVAEPADHLGGVEHAGEVQRQAGQDRDDADRQPVPDEQRRCIRPGRSDSGWPVTPHDPITCGAAPPSAGCFGSVSRRCVPADAGLRRPPSSRHGPPSAQRQPDQRAARRGAADLGETGGDEHREHAVVQVGAAHRRTRTAGSTGCPSSTVAPCRGRARRRRPAAPGPRRAGGDRPAPRSR